MERRKETCMEVDANYYDLRDVLACKQILRCVFSNMLADEVFHLIGQRAPDMETPTICQADLPLFMVRNLPNCRVMPPTEFNRVQMDILRAAPEHVDLMHLNQFYFILAKHIARLTANDDGRLLAETVLYSFLQRCGWISNLALHYGEKSQKIDYTEVELYEATWKCAMQFRQWFNSRQSIVSRKRDSSHLDTS